MSQRMLRSCQTGNMEMVLLCFRFHKLNLTPEFPLSSRLLKRPMTSPSCLMRAAVFTFHPDVLLDINHSSAPSLHFLEKHDQTFLEYLK